MQLMRGYKEDASAVAKHLGWPEVKVQAAVHYAEAFPDEIHEAMAENDEVDYLEMKHLLPQAVEFAPKKPSKS
jgi:putative heme iron utilization protein